MTDDGWVEYADTPRQRVLHRRLRAAFPLFVVFGTASAFISKSGPTPVQDFGWIAVPIWFAGTLVVSLVVWLGTRGIRRPFAIDVGRGRIRIRGRSYAFAEVDVARIDPPYNEDHDALFLQLGVQNGRMAKVLIRDGTRPAVTGTTRDALLAVIDGSSIERPTSSYDPTGRFARFNHPGSLDRAAAARVVADPPQVGDPAP